MNAMSQISLDGKVVLWVENNPEKYTLHVDALRDRGATVHLAPDGEVAIELYIKLKPDALITDLLMPNQSGLDLLFFTLESTHKSAKTVVSSFAELAKFKNGLSRYKEKLSLIPKSELPLPHQPEFDQVFVKGILGYSSDFSADAWVKNNAQKAAVDTTFEEFKEISFSDKKGLTETVYEEAKSLIESCFAQGYEWILICGDSNKAALCEKNLGDMPSAEEINQISMQMQRAPFQFFAPMDFDDIPTKWSSNCSSSNGTKNYPTVTLQEHSFSKDFHFDTGAPFTVIDKSIIGGSTDSWLNASALTGHPIRVSGNKGTYIGEQIEQRVKILCQSGVGEEIATIKATALDEWGNVGFNRYCGENCENKGLSKSTQCHYRSALIGRNLLTDNDLSLTLDGKSLRTTIK